MKTFSKLVQLKNALYPISSNPFGKLIVFNLEQSRNASFPIAFTGIPSMFDGIVAEVMV